MKTYMKEVGKIPLLTHAQEIELSKAIMQGDEYARNRLIEANLRLVCTIAREFRGKIPYADAVQNGNLGLIRAAEGYDHTHGTRFSTYAVYWIRQTIRRAIAQHGRTIAIPHYLHEIARQTETLREKLGRPLTAHDLTTHMGMSARKAKKTAEALSKMTRVCVMPKSFDAPDYRNDDPHDDARPYDTEKLADILPRLEPRAREIIARRFGLAGHQPMTLKSIGELHGLTRERVRQLERDTLNDLRNRIAS